MNTKPPSTYALKTLEPKIPTVGLPKQTTPRSPVQMQEPKTNPVQPAQMTPDSKATTMFQTLEPKGNTMFQTLQNLQEPKGNTMFQTLQNLQEPKANTGFPNQQTMQEPKQDAVLSVPINMVEPARHRNQQLALRSDRHLYSPSDDNLMMRQIQATHAPDGREVDVRPLLHVVEDILQRAGPNVMMGLGHGNSHAYLDPHAQAHSDDFDEKTTHQVGFIGMLEALAYTIHNISCEMSCKSLGGVDAHTTTVSLFNMLNSYSWDAKVVLVLAAFAVSYGEFWLLAQLYNTNQLAKSIALLKQLPNIMEHNESLRSRFDALNNLVKAMLDVTNCIVDLSQLPSRYITPEVSAMSAATAHVPTAAYWTIRSAVACMSQIISLIGLGHEYMSSTSEVWELSSLAHKVNNIHGHLTQQLGHCYQYIGEKRHMEAYQTLIRLFETPHIDNMKIIRGFFYSKDDLPLVNGYGKKRVTVDILRRKSVLLLISDLSIPREELSILEQLYKDSRPLPSGPESPYEVVWIPVLDTSTPWNEAMQKQFETMQLEMPWHTVYQPSQVDPAVVRYIREVWHFVKRPLLVVLDPQGRVVCPNALHMMWIWGIDAFPFTSAREEALWRDETWRLELLVNGIDSTLLTWIPDGRYICLYGGEDIAWIRKFTNTARAVARAAGITLEMIYVGKSNPREKVRRNNEIIATEKLSHSWQDLTSIWFFWVRLESMMYSKMQLGKTVEKDHILQEILRLLGYDSTNQGWAIISRGGTLELAKGNGEMMLTSFTEFDQWKEHVEPKGFIPALNDHLQHIHTPHHCNHLRLPGTVGRITETIVCAECGRAMEKFYMYECCTE